jgi:hypothetical protein
MRLLIIAALASIAFTAESRAQSFGDIWPWCLQYGGSLGDGGGVNCGFATEQQCRASRSGNTDTCSPNGLFDPARHAPRSRVVPRREPRG